MFSQRTACPGDKTADGAIVIFGSLSPLYIVAEVIEFRNCGPIKPDEIMLDHPAGERCEPDWKSRWFSECPLR